MSWKTVRRLLGALFLIDGAVGFIFPEKCLRAVRTGSPMMDDILDYLADNPPTARRIAAAEVAAGLWLTIR